MNINKFKNLSSFNNYINNACLNLQKSPDSADLSYIIKVILENETLFKKSDLPLNETIQSIKSVNQLKLLADKVKEPDETNTRLLEKIMATAAKKLQSEETISLLKNVDENFYYQTLGCWISEQKIAIKELNLSEDEMLKVAPWITVLNLTDATSGDVKDSTFADEFIGQLLEATQNLEFLLIRNSNITGSAFEKFKNTKQLKGFSVMDCPQLNHDLPKELPNLISLRISECAQFNAKLPVSLPSLQLLLFEGCSAFNQELPKKLPNLQELSISECDNIDQKLPEEMPHLTELTLDACKNYHQELPAELPGLSHVRVDKEICLRSPMAALLMTKNQAKMLSEMADKIQHAIKTSLTPENIRSLIKKLPADSLMILSDYLKDEQLTFFTPDIIKTMVDNSSEELKKERLGVTVVFQRDSGAAEKVINRVINAFQAAEFVGITDLDAVMQNFMNQIPLSTFAAFAAKNTFWPILFALDEKRMHMMIPPVPNTILLEYLKKHPEVQKEILQHATTSQKMDYINEDLLQLISPYHQWERGREKINEQIQGFNLNPTEDGYDKLVNLWTKTINSINLNNQKYKFLLKSIREVMSQNLSKNDAKVAEKYIDKYAKLGEKTETDVKLALKEMDSKIMTQLKDKIGEKLIEIPEEFYDSLTFSIMKNPYRDQSGNVCDKSTWDKKDFNPFTRGELDLVPDTELKNKIHNFFAENTELAKRENYI